MKLNRRQHLTTGLRAVTGVAMAVTLSTSLQAAAPAAETPAPVVAASTSLSSSSAATQAPSTALTPVTPLPAKPKAAKNPKRADRNAQITFLETPPSKDQPFRGKVELQAATSKIDSLVTQKLASEKIQPNAPASDEIFVRRIYLDVIGRVPTKAETVSFLESKEADKRRLLIDKLLNSDGYVQSSFNFWADVLRVKNGIAPGGQGREAGAAYIQWLKQSLRENKPYDLMVRELLTADGATYEDGAMGFYMRDLGMPLDNMAVTTQVFLDTQMVCAQCHNHPFDKWSQMDYFQMAAHSNGMAGSNNLANAADVNRFMTQQGIVGEDRRLINKAFGEILFRLRFNHVFSLDRTLKLPGDYQYKDAKPNASVAPMIPASFSKDGKIVKDDQPPIIAYSQWMTSRENPRFTLVVANRLWKKVMGMGVIDPVDELTDSTVPSNPQLMEFLEQTMKDVNYDMKSYLRILLNSKTYQREAYTADVELGAQYHFPGPLLRRMSAEQIWDSLVAMAKESPDEASHATYLETQQLLTKVEWMDRTILTQTPAELVEGARKIATYGKELNEDIQAKTAALKAGTLSDDEVREAKKAARTQRLRIYEKSDEIVFNQGFQKLAERILKGEFAAVAKETDHAFAAQIESAVKHFGRVPTMDEALDFVLASQKKQLAELQTVQRDRETAEWDLDTKDKKENYKKFADFRDRFLVRAADLRNPAPNGHFLRLYGQSDRELVENSNRDASVMQALTMMNGALFRNLLSPFTVLTREVRKDGKDLDAAIDTMYLSTLSRRATAEEKAVLRPMIEQNPLEGRGDVLWTILNTRQFLFIQ
ncbi:MAG: DUF1549 domain-containing protein [Verrucomicrobium sp.]